MGIGKGPGIVVAAAALIAVFAIAGAITRLSENPSQQAGRPPDSAVSVVTAAYSAASLWTLGTPDGVSSEFSGYETQSNVFDLDETAGGWKRLPKGLNKAVNPQLTVRYRLNTLPEHGLLLKVAIVDAHKSVPQMAVFSNRMLSGIVQIAGVGGTSSAYPYKKTYQLYIPKEQLRVGANELKLSAVGCLYCGSGENRDLWWVWDYLRMEKLTEPAPEPIHGRYVNTGTTVNNLSFYYDAGAVRHLPYALKWLGIAYSGNIMRTGCATDVKYGCAAIGAYYETLRDYNTQAVSFHLHTGGISLQPDGSLPDAAADKLEQYLRNYGSLFQYYEIDNEPGLFNRSKRVNLAVAEWLNDNIPRLAPGLRTVAPGWAYHPVYAERACRNQTAGGPARCGDPDGWERDPLQRRQLEDLTDFTNGHAYGSSYADNAGGSFVENLRTFGGSGADGLPKPMINTEFGTSDTHVDYPAYGAASDQSAVFDRIMRAHIGYADMFTQHAAFYNGFSLFETGFDLLAHNPALTAMYEWPGQADSRLDVMRRLNLAYATHGRPLVYRVENAEALYDRLVYVRAVDTSTLEPLPVSGGVADKQIVSLVNFEDTPQTVRVRVEMPQAGGYEAERYGPGRTYEEARTYLTGLNASPDLLFEERLGPGESVQYILTRVGSIEREAPAWVRAKAIFGHRVSLDWLEAEGAAAYDVLRSDDGGKTFRTVVAGLAKTHYIDATVAAETAYLYSIRPVGTDKRSLPAAVFVSDYVELDRGEWTVSASQGKPANAIDIHPYTRWDTGQAQRPGQFYRVDLPRPTSINRVTLSASDSPYDYPRGFALYVSPDGVRWDGPIVSGKGTVETDIAFAPVTVQAVRIVQTGTAGNYWSIHELRIFGRED